jgi:dTDP-4-dehydrorhamnose reductase
VVVTGARGTLGVACRRILDIRGLSYVALSHDELEICDEEAVDRALDDLRPWAVVNAGGYVRVDQAEDEPDACFAANAHGPLVLARACEQYGAQFLTFSSDLVFDGSKGSPYVEEDPIAPLNVYGSSKAKAEREVLEALPSALVVRTSAFFGPWDEANFLWYCARQLEQATPFPALGDVCVSPTYVPDLVNAALDLLIDREAGLWHLANQGSVTWSEFARAFAERSSLDPSLVIDQTLEEVAPRAPRPRYSVLGSSKAWIMPSLDDALARFVEVQRG